jgi:hypothetical protein
MLLICDMEDVSWCRSSLSVMLMSTLYGESCFMMLECRTGCGSTGVMIDVYGF